MQRVLSCSVLETTVGAMQRFAQHTSLKTLHGPWQIGP